FLLAAGNAWDGRRDQLHARLAEPGSTECRCQPGRRADLSLPIRSRESTGGLARPEQLPGQFRHHVPVRPERTIDEHVGPEREADGRVLLLEPGAYPRS